MNITLKNIIPQPIRDTISSSSQVWNKELVFKQGEFYHVLAPSGSGKTSLVSFLSGIRNDFEGSLLFDGEDSREFSKSDWADKRAKHISTVFQDLKMLPELSGLENVMLKNQVKNTFSEKELDGLFGALGVLQLKDKPVQYLSRGEQQRFAIIRSLCMPFDWFVMDEPFSHLDEENSLKAAQLIADVVAQNKAGIIMLNLYEDNHFQYAHQIKMMG